ncbi:MAG: efflux RND transporter periplasmic adaptor subunit, partial [Candidatus Binatus sp.]
MKRRCSNRRTAAIFAAAVAIALLAGCGGEKPAGDEAAAPSNPVLLVSAARAEVHPMTSNLRLLGKTVATRHVIIRAPTAGRVIGLKLTSGDSVRKGKVVAHVINRELEAAEAGLAVARKIDPQDAKALSASVGRYSHSAGIPVVAPESGIVSQPPVSSGQMVADLDTLVDLIDPASLYIDTSVPVNQLSLVKPGMSATVTTPFHPGVEFPARIAAIMPTFDAASAT